MNRSPLFRTMMRLVGASILVSLTLSSMMAAGQQQVPAAGFGLNDLFAGELASWRSPWPNVTFGAHRLWDSGVAWNQVETSRGVYDWSTFDNWVSLDQSHGVRIEYTFGHTPSWAGPGDTLPPTNMQDWDDYVKAVVTRYKGKIEAYEIWNEVNSSSFWTGTVGQLVTMQQHAYNIIKSIDSGAIVLSPSFAGGGMGNLQQFLAAGAASYVDGVAVHLYPWPMTNPQPEVNIGSWIATYRNYMTQYGIGSKPLWNTEFGWGLNSQLTSASAQAAYVARSYLFNWSNGVARSYWYAYDNNSWGTLLVPNSGNPGTLTAAGVAYKVVRNWMVGSTMTTPCAATSGTTVWTCGLKLADGTSALAVWNTAGSSSYPPPSGYTQSRDLTGSTGNISGSVTIGIQPLLLVNSTMSGGPAAPTNLTAVVQ